MGHAFVSYAHDDYAYVSRLVTWLRERGVHVWLDDDIDRGARWADVLEVKVRTCDSLLLVMSPAAARSSYVRREVDLARDLGKPIVPLLLDGEPIFDLGRLQYEAVRGGFLPSAAFVDRLPKVTGLPTREPPPRVRHLIGLIPNAADCFQDRGLLSELESTLAGGGSSYRDSSDQARILAGPGGVGKTQLAAALARRLLDTASLEALVWATARSRDDVLTTFARAGHELCGADLTDPQAAARTFLEWLGKTVGHWLIVLDDLADPADLHELWPPRTATGRVVVTTRRRDAALASHGQLVPVGVFSPEEARAYLAEKFRDHPHMLMGADALAADVGHLPLMLAQASAFIRDQMITCADYRRRLAQSRSFVDLLPDESGRPDGYRRDAAASLLLSLAAADSLPPTGLASRLLTMFSLLDPNGIPEEIVTVSSTVDYLGTGSADMALAGLANLSRFSLVDRTIENGRRVRVHALAQRAARDRASTRTLGSAAVAAADALVAIWPEIEHHTDLAQALRANTAALRAHAEDRLWAPHAHPVLFRAGLSLSETGLILAACEHFERLTSEAIRRLGAEHPDTLTSRGNLARCLGAAGDAAAAWAAFEALLIDYLRVFGPDHPLTLGARGNLAYFRGEAGDPSGAAAAMQALTADLVRVLGPDHPDTLSARGNLARWLGEAGDLAGAAAEFEALIRDQVRVLGPVHPDTLRARGGLAYVRGQSGDPAGAAASFETLVTDRLSVLGPDHPLTLAARHNLALMRGRAGDAAGAAAEFRSLLADQLRVLGPHHPYTITARSNLAYWQQQAERAR